MNRFALSDDNHRTIMTPEYKNGMIVMLKIQNYFSRICLLAL